MKGSTHPCGSLGGDIGRDKFSQFFRLGGSYLPAFGFAVLVNKQRRHQFHTQVFRQRLVLVGIDFHDEQFVVLKPLKQWEDRLPSENFMRIHRSAIVNLNHVERIEQWFSRTGRVHVRGLARPLPMSQRFNARFRRGLAS